MEQGGKSFGSIARWQPVVAMYGVAFITSRRSTVRGRPIRFGGGMKGATSAHSRSFGSLAQRGMSRRYPRRAASVRGIVTSVRYGNRTEPQPAETAQLFSSRALRAPNDLETLRNYLSEMTMVDDGVGRVIAVLRTLEIDDDTIVVYTTDHGFSLGHHGIWGHSQATLPAHAHRESFSIPLIVRHGDALKNGRSAELISQVDILPSLLNLTGLPASDLPANCTGRQLCGSAGRRRSSAARRGVSRTGRNPGPSERRIGSINNAFREPRGHPSQTSSTIFTPIPAMISGQAEQRNRVRTSSGCGTRLSGRECGRSGAAASVRMANSDFFWPLPLEARIRTANYRQHDVSKIHCDDYAPVTCSGRL